MCFFRRAHFPKLTSSLRFEVFVVRPSSLPLVKAFRRFSGLIWISSGVMGMLSVLSLGG